MKKIGEIAANLGIEEDEVEQYGHYKAKLNQNLFNRLADKPDGKLILVTAINPTPAGEGKTHHFGRSLRSHEQDRQKGYPGSA